MYILCRQKTWNKLYKLSSSSELFKTRLRLSFGKYLKFLTLVTGDGCDMKHSGYGSDVSTWPELETRTGVTQHCQDWDHYQPWPQQVMVETRDTRAPEHVMLIIVMTSSHDINKLLQKYLVPKPHIVWTTFLTFNTISSKLLKWCFILSTAKCLKWCQLKNAWDFYWHEVRCDASAGPAPRQQMCVERINVKNYFKQKLGNYLQLKKRNWYLIRMYDN